MAELDEHPRVLTRRLGPVLGDNDKRNDVIWAGQRDVAAQRNVVFFEGDVQDYVERMLAHTSFWKYAFWDLETMARVMLGHFPGSHVWVIKAAQLKNGASNTYENFVQWNASPDGPNHWTGQHSWRHLNQLLVHSTAAMNDLVTNDTTSALQGQTGCQSFDADLPLTLVGFSKGCVVLNQLLYDFVEESSDTNQKKIEAFYWLDGGHSGGSKTWVTDDMVLENFVARGKNIAVNTHVTPKQIADPHRPWLGQEYREFVNKLTLLGHQVTDEVHFANDKPSLERHFQVLLEFKY